MDKYALQFKKLPYYSISCYSKRQLFLNPFYPVNLIPDLYISNSLYGTAILCLASPTPVQTNHAPSNTDPVFHNGDRSLQTS